MRYRKLDDNDDYVFGAGQTCFFIDRVEAVAQAVRTRLMLVEGEWFLDTADGTPYYSKILGTGTQTTYDLAIRERILNTQGVTGITAYSSTRNRDARSISVAATIDTLYGQTTIEQVIQ